ncbi:MAG: UDP-N-acetylglucosamine 1-carboxyvinyltransferase [Candidatus Marinimicrobia bacterium]|nr:UDP-N-acetylglucosamine 1-carboxyvinyltransferase [Candidatus Neomarinimicrobiota bacterium]
MDKFVIEGGHSLSGEISVSGAKNAALPIMAATILWPDRYVLTNVPHLRDTLTMARLMGLIGARLSFQNNRMEIDTTNCDKTEAPYELVKTMRASFYVLGPLLARFGRCRVSLPGGCNWGPRPVDLHLKALQLLGADISLEEGYIIGRGRLKGAAIHFETSSVGATGNTLMAAVRAEGETVITNAAREPEITALAHFLQALGAQIEGIGTTTLIIVGQPELHGAEYAIIPDRIEAATFLIAGALLGDGLKITGAREDHVAAVLNHLKAAGALIRQTDGSLEISRPASLIPVDIVTKPYPGYPTDLQAQWIVLMSQAEGTSAIRDTIYSDRFTHVPELVRLGAMIKVEGNQALVAGPTPLIGAPVMSTDIRASAALLLAALAARGSTEISRVYHIDRGYEAIEKKFSALGARIERIRGEIQA